MLSFVGGSLTGSFAEVMTNPPDQAATTYSCLLACYPGEDDDSSRDVRAFLPQPTAFEAVRDSLGPFLKPATWP